MAMVAYGSFFCIKKCKLLSIANEGCRKFNGVLLPKAALENLNVARGDTLYLVENADEFTLTPYQADFEEQMTAAENVLKKYRNAFRELAK